MQHLLGDNRGVPDRQSCRKICLQLPFKKVSTRGHPYIMAANFKTLSDPPPTHYNSINLVCTECKQKLPFYERTHEHLKGLYYEPYWPGKICSGVPAVLLQT